MVHSFHRVAGGKVDVLLALLHTGDVLVQRHQLFLGGGIEQHQILKHILLLAVVVHGTELDLAAEGLPEGLIFLAFVPQQTLQLSLDLFFQVGADELQLAVVLQKLTGDIQVQIRGLHHTADKVEALGQQFLTLVHDHHAGGVQLQPALELLGVVAQGRLLWYKQQSLIGHGALGRDGDDTQRRLAVRKALPIELVIFFFLDVGLLPLPQGHHAVQRLPLELLLVLGVLLGAALLQLRVRHAHTDGETDIVGILFHQLVQGILPQVLAVFVLFLLGVGLDVHDDIGAHRILLAGLNGIAIHAGGLPLPGLVLAVFLRDDGDLVGHHESGVEAHAELADDVGIGALVTRHFLAEFQTAGEGDDAQVVLQLLLTHADAVIADGQQAVLLINGQLDLKLIPVQAHLVVRQAQVAQLVDSVGGVRDDLPQEYLLMGVDGIDHQVQQALALRLECLFLHTCSDLLCSPPPFPARCVETRGFV